jgi:hypothetical protein
LSEAPFVVFHQLFPEAPAPRPADPTLAGSVPLRAWRHCLPFTSASGFGWYLFPPIEFSLLSDGDVVYWRASTAERWRVLDAPALLPGFADHCVQVGADELTGGGAPPFLGRGSEPNLVQIWTGILARTQPGWSLSLRPVANHPRDSRFEILDGLVQTDIWFGPLVTPVRLRKTDEAIRLLPSQPLCQLQPVLTDSYTRADHTTYEVRHGVAAMTDDDWRYYRQSLPGPHDPAQGRHGSYQRRARRPPRPAGSPPAG